jgi:hypothetical protein
MSSRNSILVVMAIVIASPFLFHFQDAPEETATKVSAAAAMGILSLSCLAAGGFTRWLKKMRHPGFAIFWLSIVVLGAIAPFVALRFKS